MSDIESIGKIGEQKVREYFKNVIKVESIFQIDWVVLINGEYFLIEVKHQELFKKPPFDGHGLPIYQVTARMEFYKKTGIRPILFVIEKNNPNVFYYQLLDKLEKTPYYDTEKSGRRIYNIKYFKKAILQPGEIL